MASENVTLYRCQEERDDFLLVEPSLDGDAVDLTIYSTSTAAQCVRLDPATARNLARDITLSAMKAEGMEVVSGD